MEHNASQNSKIELFSTANILAAFERVQEDFEVNLKPKIVQILDTFKFGDAVQDVEQNEPKIQPQSNQSLNNIEMVVEKTNAINNASENLKACITAFPEFPWAITSNEVVLPIEIKNAFRLTDNFLSIKYEDGAICTPDLVRDFGAVDYAFKECNNWHRSTLLNTAGISYVTMYKDNAMAHQDLFADSLLSQAFGFFSRAGLVSSETNPLGAMGFCRVRKPEPDQSAVISMIPNFDDLCLCLQLLLKLGVCLGTNEILLPVCVTEYKAVHHSTDMTKLTYEMDRARQIHDKIWKVPPKVHYGIYIDDNTWYIRAIGEGSPRTVRTVWTQTITNIYEAIYVAAVIYRFAAYLLDRTSKLEPDFDKLKGWITTLAKEKVSGETLQTILEALNDIGEKQETDQSESDLDANDGDTSNTEDSEANESESPPEDVIKFFDSLAGYGFHGIKLLKDHGETKIYECRKGKGKGAIKIGPWNRIEREAKALLRLRGPGVEKLLTFARIENGQFGYMVLERLYPLPKHIKTTRELQIITEEIMGALARIHGKNYLHRDIKRSNIMMDSYKNVKVIDFECAMKEDAEDFDVFYGTNFYKPRELHNSHTPYCMTPQLMRRCKLHGSVEADSYSAALVCASLMYDIDIEADPDDGEEENIDKLRKWLYERKIAHVATPNAAYYKDNTNLSFEQVDLFRWMLEDNPMIRLSAAQAMKHPFITEYIPKDEMNEQANRAKTKPEIQSSFDKENLNPNRE